MINNILMRKICTIINYLVTMDLITNETCFTITEIKNEPDDASEFTIERVNIKEESDCNSIDDDGTIWNNMEINF